MAHNLFALLANNSIWTLWYISNLINLCNQSRHCFLSLFLHFLCSSRIGAMLSQDVDHSVFVTLKIERMLSFVAANNLREVVIKWFNYDLLIDAGDLEMSSIGL